MAVSKSVNAKVIDVQSFKTKTDRMLHKVKTDIYPFYMICWDYVPGCDRVTVRYNTDAYNNIKSLDCIPCQVEDVK